MGLPRYELPKGSRFVESHNATVAGVPGEIHILSHLTDKGFIYECVFACEIATQPCHIGEAYRGKPSQAQIDQSKANFVDYIEQQKAIREGWN